MASKWCGPLISVVWHTLPATAYPALAHICGIPFGEQDSVEPARASKFMDLLGRRLRRYSKYLSCPHTTRPYSDDLRTHSPKKAIRPINFCNIEYLSI